MTKRFGIADGPLARISALFEKYPQVTEVIVFGSRVKGNYREGSDIDLALKGKGLDATLLTQIEMDYDLLYLPWKLNMILYDTISNADLKDHIDRVGVELIITPSTDR